MYIGSPKLLRKCYLGLNGKFSKNINVTLPSNAGSMRAIAARCADAAEAFTPPEFFNYIFFFFLLFFYL